MKEKDKLDRLIDDHLEDKHTKPRSDFTATVLERIQQVREDDNVFTSHRPWWWIPVFAAATIALALYLPRMNKEELGDKTQSTIAGPPNETENPDSFVKSKDEMEDIFVMEKSLQDFEILLEDNALDILALLEE